MVIQTGVLAAHDAFHKKLQEFVDSHGGGGVEVFESPPGILWANIGTNGFRDIPSTRRQEMIWEHLRCHLSAEELHYCWGVHCMDSTEYRASMIARGPIIADRFVTEETDDNE